MAADVPFIIFEKLHILNRSKTLIGEPAVFMCNPDEIPLCTEIEMGINFQLSGIVVLKEEIEGEEDESDTCSESGNITRIGDQIGCQELLQR
jgi:hypothetical protein